jgi:hypothetical protein
VVLVGSPGSKLLFTNAHDGGVQLTGDGPSLSSMVVSYSSTPTGTISAGVFINGATHFNLKSVTVNACPADNIDCFGAGPGTIASCLVSSSQQSSLLIKDCTDVNVTQNSMPNIGVITAGGGSSNLNIAGNTFTSTSPPNLGYSAPKLTGLFNSSFTGNTIKGGALYIGSAPFAPNNLNFADGDVFNMQVSGNILDGSAVTPSISNFLGIIVDYYGNNGGSATFVTVSGNTVQNLVSPFGIAVCPGASNTVVSGNTITNVTREVNGYKYTSSGVVIETAANTTVQNNSISNTFGPAIRTITEAGSGLIKIVGNKMASACTTAPSHAVSDYAVIEVDPSVLSGHPQEVDILNNEYDGPAGVATAFIDLINPNYVTKITGNVQTSTTLPNKP